ncbi:hypothetical protein VTK26DRAFT_389 [Humicola hyalothermophila]
MVQTFGQPKEVPLAKRLVGSLSRLKTSEPVQNVLPDHLLSRIPPRLSVEFQPPWGRGYWLDARMPCRTRLGAMSVPDQQSTPLSNIKNRSPFPPSGRSLCSPAPTFSNRGAAANPALPFWGWAEEGKDGLRLLKLQMRDPRLEIPRRITAPDAAAESSFAPFLGWGRAIDSRHPMAAGGNTAVEREHN